MTTPTPSAPPSPPPASPRAARPYTYRGEGMSWFQPIMWDSGRFLSRLLSMLLFRFHARGTSNLPRTGPALLVTNHQSFLDPWLIGIALPRQLHYMARDTLFKGGFLHWLMESLNAFPVKRGHGDRAAIRTATERLEKGYLVNIFPEGTRSEDGTIGPIAPGIALILRGVKRPVPIIPVLIDGAFEAWPRHQKLPHPRPIRILYGTPIPLEEAKSLTPDALAQRIRAELVKLQFAIHSPHAAASATRLAAEEKPARS